MLSIPLDSGRFLDSATHPGEYSVAFAPSAALEMTLPKTDCLILHYHQSSAGSVPGWFGSGIPPTDWTLTWTFLAKEQAAALLEAITALNEQDLERPVRAFQMNVECAA